MRCLLQISGVIQCELSIDKGAAQFMSQTAERARETRFDGATGAAQRFGRLRFRQPEEEATGDDKPFVLAQPVDGVE